MRGVVGETGAEAGGGAQQAARAIRALRDIARVYRNVPRVVGLVREAQPGYAMAVVALHAIQGLEPLAAAWLTTLLIDAISAALVGGEPAAGGPIVSRLVGLWIAVAILGAALPAPTSYAWQQLGDHVMRLVNQRILAKANSLHDLAFFESPRFYDLLLRAQQQANRVPIAMVQNLGALLRTWITFVSMVAVLAALNVPLTVAIILTNLPLAVVLFRQRKDLFAMNDWQIPEVRMMHYYRLILTGREVANEIRLFGLGNRFVDDHERTFESFHRRHATLRWRHWRRSSAAAVLAAVGSAAAFAYVLLAALGGALSPGGALLAITALLQAERGLAAVIREMAGLYETSLFARNLFEFLDLPPSMEEAPPGLGRPAPARLRCGIELRDVAFAYPGSDRRVLDRVSLVIRPGETVALVGANGAGKTTLVKLLSRLYDPTEGHILVDGVDLREYDLESWRRRLAVVFQDFVRFDLLARENIGLGSVGRLDDLSVVRGAARRAGADGLITGLPRGYDTMLGRRFATRSPDRPDGVDLSGGQWQRIALARAFMRAPEPPHGTHPAASAEASTDGGMGAQLLVLDEPTAALDARAEHDLFLRFADLTRGRSTLLISHRFSTVKMADRIAVLEGGRITEVGTHDQLRSRGGAYARLYTMQAERYTDAPEAPEAVGSTQ